MAQYTIDFADFENISAENNGGLWMNAMICIRLERREEKKENISFND